MARIIQAEDDLDRTAVEGVGGGERAILICTHAASMIAIGRALTGRMPEDICEEDFKTFTCGVSTFRRRTCNAVGLERARSEALEGWEPGRPIPRIRWMDGKGVGGGWDCEVNGDCSFLEDGQERGW